MNKKTVNPILIFFMTASLIRAQMLVITDSGNDAVIKSTLDGSMYQQILTGKNAPSGIAVHTGNSRLIWADAEAGAIYQSDYDGGNTSALVTGLGTPRGVTVSSDGQYLFWTDSKTDEIKRCGANGSNVITLFSGSDAGDGPKGIAYVSSGNLLVWADGASGVIKQGSAAGTGSVTTLVSGLSSPYEVEVDEAGGKMYWTETRSSGRICRSDLDGTDVETLISVAYPRGLYVDVSTGNLYYSTAASANIYRSALNGSNVQTLVSGIVSAASFLARTPGSDIAPIPVAVKVILDGAWDADGDSMITALYSGGHLPASSPYGDDHVLTGGIPNNDIVDWVWVELRETADGSAVASKSALLRKDGIVVGDDGVTEYIFMDPPKGMTVDYYIVVTHRNHVKIMSATPWSPD